MNLLCLNCGKQITVNKKKFTVCDCGCTEYYDPNKRQYIANIDDEKILIQNGDDKYCVFMSDADTTLSQIAGLPVKNAMLIKEKIYNSCSNKEQNFIRSFPCWAIISHKIQMRYSAQYRYAYEHNFYEFIWNILCSGKLLNMPQQDAIPMMSRTIKYKQYFPENTLLFAYEAFLYGFKLNEAIIISKTGISSQNIVDILAKTDFSRKELFAYIDKLYDLHYPTDEIIRLIFVYDETLRKLVIRYGVSYVPERKKDFDISIATARAMLSRLDSENYLIKKQLTSFMYERYPASISIENLTLCVAQINDAVKYCSIVPSSEQLTFPAYYALYNNKIIGIFYFGKSDIYWKQFLPVDDRIRKTINLAIDKMYKEEESHAIV